MSISARTSFWAAASAGALMNLFASATTAQERGPGAITLEEIIVTAQKREQRVQDVPISISVLGLEEIERKSLVSFDDFLRNVPGVTHAPVALGQNTITLRGLSAGFFNGDATVGVYFGEVPLTGVARDTTSVDMKLVDMERVEVLRGPQGTLYGANSLGGTLRHIPAAPNLNDFQAEIDVGYSQMARRGDDSTKMSAVLNAPLIADHLALRVVGYRFDNTGFVRNIAGTEPSAQAAKALYGATAISEDNQAATEYRGVRATLLWEPTDALSVSLMYAWQSLYQDGTPYVNTTLAEEYAQSFLGLGSASENGRAFFSDENDVGNLVLNYDFGPVSLLASSSIIDGGWSFGEEVRLLGGVRTPAAIYNEPKRHYVSHEARLSSELDGPLQFIVGYFNQDAREATDFRVRWSGSPDLFPGPLFGVSDPNAVLLGFTRETRIEQQAVFGEAVYQFLNRFELTVGARHFEYDRDAIDGNTLSGTSQIATSDDGNTLKTNLSFKPNEDTMLYAQWAQGFRLGRPVAEPTPFFLANCDTNQDGILDGTGVSYAGDLKSDTTDNYELGGKFTFMDKRFVVNAAVYHVDWQDLPVTIPGLTPSCTAVRNAGSATSQGAEAEVQLRLTDAWRVDLNAAYNNAELAETAPTIGGKGDPVPFSADFTGGIGLTYEFQIAGYDSFVAGDYNYQSDYYATVNESSLKMGDFGLLGLRAGIAVRNVDLQIYGTNLTNEDALVYAGLNPETVIRVQPRVIGVSAKYRF